MNDGKRTMPIARPIKEGTTRRSIAVRYGVALLAVTLGVVLTYSLDPLYNRAVFLLLLPVIIFATWYGGAGPGIAALVTATLGAWYLILPSAPELFIADRQDVLRLLFFVATSAFVFTSRTAAVTCSMSS